MGKPAARIGDMTAHGGSIVLGCPTVLIGGMPAARLTDMHVCPMVTPGTPPIPHVGGPIILGSAGVLIGGMPAARMGDMATCVGPPDMIALGCMTVLIGETMAGAAAAPGPIKVGLNSAAVAHLAAATALSDNKETSTRDEHWVELQFVDKAGLPVSGVHYKFTDPDGKEDQGVLRPNGRIRRDALNAGQCSVQLYSVSNAKWSKDKSEVGEKVKLMADVEGYPDGTPSHIQIYKRDIKGPDKVIANIEKEVRGGKIETEWEYILDEGKNEKDNGEAKNTSFSAPQYCFDVVVENVIAHSGLLEYKDYIELEVRDINDNPLGGEEFLLYGPNGEVRKGKLDSNGYKKIEKIVPGKYYIRYPNIPNLIDRK